MGKNNTTWTADTAPRGGNGRPPGVRNKITQQIRDNFLIILQEYNKYDRLRNDLDAMRPYDRRKTLEGLTKYILPALSQNDNKNSYDGQMNIIVEYMNPTAIAQPSTQDNSLPNTLAGNEVIYTVDQGNKGG